MRATIRPLLLKVGVLGFIFGMTYLVFVPRFRPVAVVFFVATGLLLFVVTGIRLATRKVGLRGAALNLILGATQFCFAWALAMDDMETDLGKLAAVLVIGAVVLADRWLRVHPVPPPSRPPASSP